jgi:hypothetical protein
VEYKLELHLVTKDQTNEDCDFIRAVIDTPAHNYIGWGKTVSEALEDLDADLLAYGIKKYGIR